MVGTSVELFSRLCPHTCWFTAGYASFQEIAEAGNRRRLLIPMNAKNNVSHTFHDMDISLSSLVFSIW